MSTLVSCTSNPITQLTTTLFQDSTWQSTSPFFTTDGTHSQLGSFRSHTSPDSTDCFESSWNNFTQDWQQFRETSTNDNDEDEFRQEWSNESFTQFYIQQNGLDKLRHNYANVNINHNVNTRISARSENNGMTFADEFLSLDSTTTTLTEEFKTFLSDTTSDILYSDLYSAHLYLLDQFLSRLLDHAIASTCKPSPSSEWNFTKLFCPSRWNNREDEKTLEEKYLEGVATGRLSMLLGHLGKGGGSIEWAGEFCMS